MINGTSVKSATLRMNAGEALLMQRGVQRVIQRLEKIVDGSTTEGDTTAAEAAQELHLANELQQKLSEFAARNGWL